jgi:two-component system OmpR family response regulator
VLVSRLRRKLDRTENHDRGDSTSVIKTIRTGGYIFTPRVEEA